MAAVELDLQPAPDGGFISTANNLAVTARGIGKSFTGRAFVSVHRSGTTIDNDTFAIATAKKRTEFLQRPKVAQLNDSHLIEGMLVALSERLAKDRSRPAAPQPAAPAIADSDALPDVTPSTLEELEGLISQRLLLADRDVLPVVLGARQAHHLPGVPCWLMVVGPPSGTKTELVSLTQTIPGTYALSELTAKTFASGMKVDPGEDNPSLLSRLKDEVLLFKDFTTVLEMHREERQAILAQLREIYDGKYDKVWGTGKDRELHWTGRLGFLAGVTEAIDKHHAVMALLGPRFLMFRPTHADRRAIARRAIDNTAESISTDRVRARDARAVAAYLATLPTIAPTVSDDMRNTLTRLADLVTRARSAVTRDGYSRELEYTPAPEIPARFAEQVFALLRGVALVRQHPAVTADDVRITTRVALDSIPSVRRRGLSALLQSAGMRDTTALANDVGVPTTTIRRAMEELQAQGLIHCHKVGSGKADQWTFADEWRSIVEEFMRATTTVPEMSEQEHISQNLNRMVV